MKVELFRNNDTVQCKRCQRFDHVAANCNMSYRCVRCTDEHGPSECPLREGTPEENADKVRCVNCEENHTANYRGCPKLREYKERLREKKNKATDTKSKAKQVVSKAVSFARVACGAPAGPSNLHSPPAESQSGDFAFINNEFKKFFDADLVSVLTKAKNFKASYARLKNDDQKKQALINFMLSL